MSNQPQRTNTRLPVLALLLVLFICLIVAGGAAYFLLRNRMSLPFSPTGTQQIPVNLLPANNTGGAVVTQTVESGAPLQLSEGQAQPETVQRLPVATGEPLSQAQVDQILARLPTLVPQPGQQTDFKLAQQPIPPPRPGTTVQGAFPPPTQPPPPDPASAGPLQVLRFAPEGEIPTAPFISVTFNQPMVPLTTLADLSARDVPVRVEPPLEGTWRWIGVKTLTFEYDSALIDRLPKATEYHISVPAGTRSQTGGVLAETVEWKFTTPPPRVVATYPPDSPQPLKPLFFIQFDQRIDPAAVLKTIQVNAGGQPVALQLAGEEETQVDKGVSRMIKNAATGRWLAFRAVQPLPADTGIAVTIGPGTPSAEGPLLTKEAQTYGFRTYAPLRIESHGCSWTDENTCRPLSPFYIRFNNNIDVSSYAESMLHIAPELAGVSANIYGNTITIKGATQGQTTYTVDLSGKIKDVFGQELGQDARLTFQVGKAEAVLFGPKQGFVTIDPFAGKPQFSVYTINYTKLNVQIYAVQPSDWPAYKQYLRDFQRNDVKTTPPGRRVFNKAINIEAESDALIETGIDLSPYMDGSFGHFVVIVEPPTGWFQQKEYWRTVQSWVQITQVGLDAFVDHSDMVVWATSLKDGDPLSGIDIAAETSGKQAATGSDGLARFAIPNNASYLVASSGADKALLPRSTAFWSDETWAARPVLDTLRWYVFDDRQMYRPGEEIHIKGWMRRIGGKQNGDVGPSTGITAVNYRITEPQGNEIGTGRAEVNALGGFDFAFTLPEAVNLGNASIYIYGEGNLGNLEGNQYYHSFQIQEFRRPEFEVKASNETPGPYFAGDHTNALVEARYYAGGPLPGAEVSWQVTTAPGSYTPPNWSDFTFGTWQPWWFYGWGDGGSSEGGQTETFNGRTDAAGVHRLRLDFNQNLGPRPLSVVASATVMDVNRQAWGATTTLLVHPASLYVGMRSERYFVERGTPLEIDLIVTNLDGKPVIDRPIKVRAARLDWKYHGDRWGEEEADVQECTAGSKSEPVRCTFETALGGSYRITAEISDELGRKNQSQFIRWVSGGQRPAARNVEQEQVTLIPDKESYQPGDVANILVQPPFSPAEGLLTVSRSGLLYTERFQVTEGAVTLKIPIAAGHIPNLNIQVDLTGSANRLNERGETVAGAPRRPAYATAQLTLNIPPTQRRLTLSANLAAAELEPGQETTLDVTVKDAAGQPVSDAELAVVVVDEAILALSNYNMADPLFTFYTARPAELESLYGRASILLANPQELAEEARQKANEADGMLAGAAAVPAPAMEAAPTMAAMADEAKAGAAAPQPIRMRMDFNPLATFAPATHTNADGTARVTIKLPDNLTRYRVMVAAVDGGSGRRFGITESNLVARLPLMVRPSAPRFLNFGDRFELPVVLQNQTAEPLTVDVAVRASNLTLTGAAGQRVTIPARDRVEVRFPATTQLAGTARFQVAAVSGSYADAATVELPVYTPATTEAFATYGVIDEGNTAQPVAALNDIFPQYGGLEISTSSTALQSLTDAVLYLVAYPFECTEQLSSRILAVAALRDVLTAFKAEGLPSASEMEAAVQRDVERLQGLQNSDGGFPYWRRGQDSIPFNTIHVAHALQRAELKGFKVPEEMKPRLLQYLRQIENYYPSWYSQHTRQTLSAYALYVRHLMGDRDPDKAIQLLDEAGLENLDLDAVGWLWQVLQDAPNAGARLEAIRKHVNNRVVETAGAANFTTSYDDQSYLLLNSDRRTDAILLEALMIDDPKSDLTPKVVNGLLAHRTRGRWGNTQENVFVLLALDRYFNTYEARTPDFVARMWLGDAYVGEHAFRGRTTERYEVTVPMSYLVDQTAAGTQNLILSKDGPGRMYYRLGLRYAPTDLELPPLDMGFTVQRVYEAVDDPKDVSQDSDGVWHIKAGARVRVRLTLVAANRRYHVALVDPLPAGLEIVNPALAVSGSIPQDPNASDYSYGWWWWRSWFEHQNLRDERAEAFTSLLWDGVYNYTYVTRATTPGRYVVPPAKAEEMYSPEVFGRSGSNIVIVE